MRECQIPVGVHSDDQVLVGVDGHATVGPLPDPSVAGQDTSDLYASRAGRQHLVLVGPPGFGLAEPFDDPSAELPETLVDRGNEVAVHLDGRTTEPSASLIGWAPRQQLVGI